MRGIVDMRSSIQLEERGIESAACRCYVAINSKPYVRYNGELWGHVSDP